PTNRRSGGRSRCPGGSARVAPLRCTHSRRDCPSTVWVSIFARLCEMSYTKTRGGTGARPEAPWGRMREQLPFGPPVVSGGRHCAEIRPPFRRGDRNACELPVRDRYGVARHRRLHDPHVVGANLVAESARPAVDHHAHLIRVKAHGCNGRLVVYLIDRLHFEKV